MEEGSPRYVLDMRTGRGDIDYFVVFYGYGGFPAKEIEASIVKGGLVWVGHNFSLPTPNSKFSIPNSWW